MAPRTEEQLKELRQDRRKKILDAALELFAMNGFHATSISKITKKAGISKGLVYNYFTSKEDILKAIIEEAMNEGEEMMEEAGQNDPQTNLKLMFEAFFREIQEKKHYWKLVTTLGLRVDEFPQINKLVKDRLMQYIETIKQIFHQLGIEKPDQEAKIVGATFDGVALHYLIGGEEYPLEEVKQYLIEKYAKF